MICTGRRELERYALGELDEARAAAVRAHVDACEQCAEEARLLAAERDLFRRRAALPAPAPPPFAAVMAEVRDGEAAARGARRAPIASALAAAAAVLGLWIHEQKPQVPRDGGAPAIAAEPAAIGGVHTDPAATERAVERIENEMGACLMATPAAAPACSSESEPPPAEAPHARDEACSVTCDEVAPHGDEGLESKAPGESTP